MGSARTSPRTAIAIAFFALQAAFILRAHFVESRYFCWAPQDSINDYELTVTINGRQLGAREVRERYRVGRKSWDDAPWRTRDTIRGYERSSGTTDDVRVHMLYRPNGRKDWELVWRWPEDSTSSP